MTSTSTSPASAVPASAAGSHTACGTTTQATAAVTPVSSSRPTVRVTTSSTVIASAAPTPSTWRSVRPTSSSRFSTGLALRTATSSPTYPRGPTLPRTARRRRETTAPAAAVAGAGAGGSADGRSVVALEVARAGAGSPGRARPGRPGCRRRPSRSSAAGSPIRTPSSISCEVEHEAQRGDHDADQAEPDGQRAAVAQAGVDAEQRQHQVDQHDARRGRRSRRSCPGRTSGWPG